MRRGRFSRVYAANHPFEAHFVRTVLESHGVWASVQNENLAPYGVGAEVWVEAAQTAEALEVVRSLRRDDGGQLSIVPSGEMEGRLATVDDASSAGSDDDDETMRDSETPKRDTDSS